MKIAKTGMETDSRNMDIISLLSSRSRLHLWAYKSLHPEEKKCPSSAFFLEIQREKMHAHVKKRNLWTYLEAEFI